MTLDLNILTIHRIKGQESTSLPGLVAVAPPRKAARGREQDRLLVYVLLTGNATFSVSDYKKIAADAAAVFFQSAGTVTSALRAGAGSVNQVLLERNQLSTGSGQHVTGYLAMACLRGEACTILMSGPIHLFWQGAAGTRHIHEPDLSGKGLGLGQSTIFHFSQAVLQSGEMLVVCGRLPSAWQSAFTGSNPSSLEATRRRLLTMTGEDLNAVLVQVSDGTGQINIIHSLDGQNSYAPTPSSGPQAVAPAEVDVSVPETQFQIVDAATAQPTTIDPPSAYAIPPDVPFESKVPAEPMARFKVGAEAGPREFPPSIPRAGSPPKTNLPPPLPPLDSASVVERSTPLKDDESAHSPVNNHQNPRQAAIVRTTALKILEGVRSWRQISMRLRTGLQNFLPRLLPGTDATQPFVPTPSMMVLFAILIPILVVTAAFTVYSRYGRSIQYETSMAQALEASRQARALTDPVEQRKAWEAVMLNLEQAESFRKTAETEQLKQEAGTSLDGLLGILRLQFTPAFSSPLGIDISRMAASETDLFLLDAANGQVLHADHTEGHGFRMDTGFNCAPGNYGGYSVGPLVDIIALPGLQSLKATVLGVDAFGNLLYCEPGQVAQAIPLPPPDTNWGRVTAFTLDAGNLFVLDAPFRAVWVFPGTDDAFIDRPYFFFGDYTPEKQDVIDLAVTGDDLYMLHADGHLSTCSYSRIEAVPTRCQDPAPFINPFPASQDEDIFSQANFTQMFFTAPPDQSILLLDADSQAVYRLTPRSLELQNQLRPTTGSSNPVPGGPVGAMAVSPNHVLYISVRGQIYFATGMP